LAQRIVELVKLLNLDASLGRARWKYTIPAINDQEAMEKLGEKTAARFPPGVRR
jgi:hypothetical protein